MCDLVSVIIPVYNVENYLDECLESVVYQTYKNLEVILIDDGSTDKSALKCRAWCKKDRRIQFYSKVNEGLGSTRNFGIKKASGKWISFLDADDWYDLQFVEKALCAALQNNADMVTCNIARKHVDTKETSYMRCSSVIGMPLSREQKLEDDRMGVVTKFCLRSLWVENDIMMPNLFGEDFAVTMWILAVSKKIVNLDDCLYYYRKGRKGSISTVAQKNRLEIVFGTEYMISGLKRCGVYEENKGILKRYLLKNYSLVLTAGWTKMPKSEYVALRKAYSDCYLKLFSDEKLSVVAQIGSYNLMQILRYMPIIQDVELSFQFSSLISIMNPFMGTLNLHHINPFREKMIQRDVKSSFFTIIKEEQPQFLVFDLIEERHNIIMNDLGIITYTDAYVGLDSSKVDGIILNFGSGVWWNLWKESAVSFIHRMFNEFSNVKLIVVENYLSETHGTVSKLTDYEDKRTIKEINAVLKKCYDFLIGEFDGITRIEAWRNPYYFTDDWFEYGAHPWHLNDVVNRSIADQIAKEVLT